jgi:cytochrome P450
MLGVSLTGVVIALALPVALFHARVVSVARRFGGPPFAGPPPRAWLLGSLVPVLRGGLLESYRRWTRRAGDDVLVWLGTRPHVVVGRADTVRQVLVDRERFVREIAPTEHLFGEGLLRLEGEVWRERRALFSPPFRRDDLEEMLPAIHAEAAALCDAWSAREGEPFHPSHDLGWTMLRILGVALFGTEFDRERHGGRALRRALIVLSTGSVKRHLLPAWGRRGEREEQAARAWMDTLGQHVLSTGRDNPFTRALRTLPEPVALDEVRTFLIAGHETSATALTWTLALLAEHPEVQDRVREELRAAGKFERLADLGRAPYTTQVLNEAMRLYPPVPISISVTTEAVTVGDRQLPAGTLVDVSAWVLHRDPLLWPDPDRFDPDRFAQPPAPGTWFPFLLGPHSCLGMRFALMEMPVVLGAILDRFKVELVTPARPDLRLSLHPAGLRIRLLPA